MAAFKIFCPSPRKAEVSRTVRAPTRLGGLLSGFGGAAGGGDGALRVEALVPFLD